MTVSDAKGPFDLEDVLLAECRAIHGAPDQQFIDDVDSGLDCLPAVMRLLHRREQWALCLSGGGIRSATFALGIVEGLARCGALQRFHYLSTVSGGGYIGGWLTRWIHEESKDGGDGLATVVAKLSRNRPDMSPPPLTADGGRAPAIRPDVDPVRRLRKYSNYLNPQLGVLSADTWTLIASYLRNLLLNWLLLIPPMLVVLLIPKLVVAFIVAVRLQGNLDDPVQTASALVAIVVAGLLSMIATIFIGLNRPSAGIATPKEAGILERCLAPLVTADQVTFLRWCLAPLMAGMVMLAIAWACWPLAEAAWLPSPQAIVDAFWLFPLAGGAARILAWSVSLFHGWGVPDDAARKRIKRPLGEAAAAGIAGAFAGCLLWAFLRLFDPVTAGREMPELYVTIAVPALLAIAFIVETLFVGLVSRFTADEDREWWARSGGWFLIAGVMWLAVAGLTLFGSAALFHIRSFSDAWGTEWLASVGGVGGLAGLLAARIGASARTPPAAQPRSGRTMTILMVLLPALFIVVLLSFLSLLVDILPAFRLPPANCAPSPGMSAFDLYLECTRQLGLARIGYIGGGLMLLCAVTSPFVHINKFSMHATYRNRLIRAYLGISRSGRIENRFTGFDKDDNLDMHKIWPGRDDSADAAAAPRSPQPFHIVNTTLNLVSGSSLAWQQRKAAPFTVSPLHCGSWHLGYRPSRRYGHREDGISLGTAIAISGAAASPNMGYHSSSVTAFLMTLFNVRLGWWLGNPGKAGDATWQEAGPKLALKWILNEMFGLTNAGRSFVYLSDGGHFENLGLYEMVLRRCRLIVVSDASCDPSYQFTDLGNAVRKIRIDLGIDIAIDRLPQHCARDDIDSERKTEPELRRYCALGRIHYPEGEPGLLIYLKPGIYGGEPADVKEYARQRRDFPHESTADQWFDESQFESYRRLGRFLARSVFADAGGNGAARSPLAGADVIAAVSHYAAKNFEFPTFAA